MAKSNEPAEGGIWDSAPETDVIPFPDATQRAALINDRVPLTVTAMEYDPQGRFGPKFIATFTTPDGEIFQLSFNAHPSRPTARDFTNKWIREQTKKSNVVPAVLCKVNGAYFLGRPGTDSERDSVFPVAPGVTDTSNDMMGEPPF